MKSGRKAPVRPHWKALASTLERENAELRKQNAALRGGAEAVTVLSNLVVENIRDEIRTMVEEEVQQLEIHVS